MRQPPTQRQRGDPVEVGVGDLRHPLLAAGHLVPLEADGPHDLGERQREHREVDAREPHAEEAEEQREAAGQEPGGGEGEQEGHGQLLHEQPGGVGADAEVGGVAEGHQAGDADQQVEAGGEQRPDHDVVGQEHVEARADRGDEERQRQDDEAPGHACECGHHLSGRPSRPQGRMISTPAMRAKTAKIENRGKNRMPNDSTWP